MKVKPNHDFRKPHMELINRRYAEFKDYHQDHHTLADAEYWFNGVITELREKLGFVLIHTGGPVSRVELGGDLLDPDTPIEVQIFKG